MPWQHSCHVMCNIFSDIWMTEKMNWQISLNLHYDGRSFSEVGPVFVDPFHGELFGNVLWSICILYHSVILKWTRLLKYALGQDKNLNCWFIFKSTPWLPYNWVLITHPCVSSCLWVKVSEGQINSGYAECSMSCDEASHLPNIMGINVLVTYL